MKPDERGVVGWLVADATGWTGAMAARCGYLDWEFGLVAQLGRDGTHGFRVI